MESLGDDAEMVEVREPVTIIKNKVTGNYAVFLSEGDFGPIIIHKDKEDAVKRFIDAFGAMLVYKSLMVAPGIKEKFLSNCRSNHTETYEKINGQINLIVNESAEKFTKIKKDLVEA
ncbi:MAG: hypothetical protein MH137_06745 [Flavobacteriales bacterium]|nr:hypothetical protein [Flavobacteriales bacterium]